MFSPLFFLLEREHCRETGEGDVRNIRGINFIKAGSVLLDKIDFVRGRSRVEPALKQICE